MAGRCSCGLAVYCSYSWDQDKMVGPLLTQCHMASWDKDKMADFPAGSVPQAQDNEKQWGTKPLKLDCPLCTMPLASRLLCWFDCTLTPSWESHSAVIHFHWKSNLYKPFNGNTFSFLNVSIFVIMAHIRIHVICHKGLRCWLHSLGSWSGNPQVYWSVVQMSYFIC